MLLYYSTLRTCSSLLRLLLWINKSDTNQIILYNATNRFGPDTHIHVPVPDISRHRFLHALDTWKFFFDQGQGSQQWALLRHGLVSFGSCHRVEAAHGRSLGSRGQSHTPRVFACTLRPRWATQCATWQRVVEGATGKREEVGDSVIQSWIISFRLGNL